MTLGRKIHSFQYSDKQEGMKISTQLKKLGGNKARKSRRKKISKDKTKQSENIKKVSILLD